MSNSGIALGIVVIVAIGAVLYFTNISDLARPVVDKTFKSTENAASSVTIKGKDVVSEIKTVSDSVQNVTSQIKIKNPYP
jgi:hypothetical protein